MVHPVKVYEYFLFPNILYILLVELVEFLAIICHSLLYFAILTYIYEL